MTIPDFVFNVLQELYNPSPDGKYHVVPSSGDLHIIRADFSDTVENYACRVRNTLNNREEISAAFNLVINGENGSFSLLPFLCQTF